MPGRKFAQGTSKYKYSINGQEKESDLSENITTAEYWQYDSRIGKRWNVDPVTKSWQSPYATFSNNPIWKMDPNGDDDYFNSQGQLIKQTKTGSKIYVQTDKGNLLLTQINLNSATNRTTVANVVGYYANKVGIIHQEAGSNANAGKGIVGLKGGSETSEKNPAFSIGKDVFVNKKGNKINSDLSDYYNLENVLTHEKGHKTNYENKVTENLQTHVNVYLGEIKDQTFRKGTEAFQKGIVGSLSNYLLNYYVRETNGGTGQLDKYIGDFNKNNKAGFKLYYDFSSGSDESGYKMNIYKNNKLTGSINYTKIKKEGSDN